MKIEKMAVARSLSGVLEKFGLRHPMLQKKGKSFASIAILMFLSLNIFAATTSSIGRDPYTFNIKIQEGENAAQVKFSVWNAGGPDVLNYQIGSNYSAPQDDTNTVNPYPVSVGNPGDATYNKYYTNWIAGYVITYSPAFATTDPTVNDPIVKWIKEVKEYSGTSPDANTKVEHTITFDTTKLKGGNYSAVIYIVNADSLVIDLSGKRVYADVKTVVINLKVGIPKLGHNVPPRPWLYPYNPTPKTDPPKYYVGGKARIIHYVAYRGDGRSGSSILAWEPVPYTFNVKNEGSGVMVGTVSYTTNYRDYDGDPLIYEIVTPKPFEVPAKGEVPLTIIFDSDCYPPTGTYIETITLTGSDKEDGTAALNSPQDIELVIRVGPEVVANTWSNYNVGDPFTYTGRWSESSSGHLIPVAGFAREDQEPQDHFGVWLLNSNYGPASGTNEQFDGNVDNRRSVQVKFPPQSAVEDPETNANKLHFTLSRGGELGGTWIKAQIAGSDGLQNGTIELPGDSAYGGTYQNVLVTYDTSDLPVTPPDNPDYPGIKSYTGYIYVRANDYFGNNAANYAEDENDPRAKDPCYLSSVIPVYLTVRGPTISTDANSFSQTIVQGANANSQTFEIWNLYGMSTLHYSVDVEGANYEGTKWLMVSDSDPNQDSTDETDKNKVTLTYNASGLKTGTYTAKITYTDENATNSAYYVNITLRVLGPVVATDKTALNPVCVIGENAVNDTQFYVWNADQKDDPPGYQGSTLNYSILTSVAEGNAWFSCEPVKGDSTGPDDKDPIKVSYNTSGLAKGEHKGTITVYNINDGTSKTVDVNLLIRSPMIAISQETISQKCDVGTNAPSQSFQIWNSGDTNTVLEYSLSVSEGDSWLTLKDSNPLHISTGATDRNTITLYYDSSALPPGIYEAEITITADKAGNSPVVIPVTLEVQAPQIALSKTVLYPTCLEGYDALPTTFQVWNSGFAVLEYKIEVTDPDGKPANWISCDPISGNSTGVNDKDMIKVKYITNAFKLAEGETGTYEATIKVSDEDSSNNPQEIKVTLVVQTPALTLDKKLLEPKTSIGGTPSRLAFELWNSSNGNVNFEIGEAMSGALTEKINKTVAITSVSSKAYSSPPPPSGNIYLTDSLGNSEFLPYSSWQVVKGATAIEDVYTFTIESGGNLTESLVAGSPLSSLKANGFLLSPALNGSLQLTNASSEKDILTYAGWSVIRGANPALDVYTFTVSSTSPLQYSYAVNDNCRANGAILSHEYEAKSLCSAASPVAWLSFAPSSGTTTGAHQQITASFDASALSAGRYDADIVVTGFDDKGRPVTGSPQVLHVVMLVGAIAELDPQELKPFCDYKTNAKEDAFTVKNIGVGTLNYTITDNAAWLSCTPASGDAPENDKDTVKVEYQTTALPAGSHIATITVTNVDTGDKTNIPVTLSVLSGAEIELSPDELKPQCAYGTDAPQDKFTVKNSGIDVLNYNITVTDYNPADKNTWISSVIPNTGSLKEDEVHEITVSYSTAALSIGTYEAKIVVADPSAKNSPQEKKVTLTVLGPTIGISPTAISVSCPLGQDAQATSFEVWNVGGGVLDYVVASDVAWITCNPLSGTSTGEHDTIAVIFTTSALPAGSHSGNITVTAAGATNTPQIIPVVVNVGKPAISLSLSELTASCVEGSNADSQNFQVWNSGNGTLSFTVSDDAEWLVCVPATGTSTGSSDKKTIEVQYLTSELLVGTYSAKISVSDSEATNSPQTINVALNVTKEVPTDGLVLHLSAGVPDITKDAVTGKVIYWPNSSEKENDASQYVSSKQPIYQEKGINDLPVLVFIKSSMNLMNADNNGINVTGIGSFTAKTIGFVFKTGGDISTKQTVLAQGSKKRGINIYISGKKLYMGAWNISNDGADSSWEPKFVSVQVLPETTYFAEFVFDSVNKTISGYLNGNLIGVSAGVGKLYNDTTPLGIGIALGSVQSAPDDLKSKPGTFTGSIAEIVYYNLVLSDVARIDLENNFMGKYAVTAPQIVARKLAFWLRSDSQVMKDDATGTVKSWTDISSIFKKSPYLRQSSSKKQPLFVPDAISNLPSIRYNGTSSVMQATSNIEINSSKDTYPHRTVFAIFNTGSNVVSQQVVWTEGDKNSGMNIFIENEKVNIGAWGLKAPSGENSWGPIFLSSSSITANTRYCVQFILNQPENVFTGYLNGLTMGSTTNVGKLFKHSAGAMGASVKASNLNGTWVSKGAFMSGDIYELIIYNSVLTEVENNSMETYISGRYGIVFP